MYGNRFHVLILLALLVGLTLTATGSFAGTAGVAFEGCRICGRNDGCPHVAQPTRKAPRQYPDNNQDQQRREANRVQKEANRSWQQEQQRLNDAIQENARRQTQIRNQQLINQMNMRLQANQNRAAALNNAVDLFGNIMINLMDKKDDPPELSPENYRPDSEVFPAPRTKAEIKKAEREAREAARKARKEEEERIRRENEPANPLNKLAALFAPLPDDVLGRESEEPQHFISDSSLKLFGAQTMGVAREVDRALFEEVVGQAEAGEEIDVGKAAYSVIKNYAKGMVWSVAEPLIERIVAKREILHTFYDIFLNPEKSYLRNPNNVNAFDKEYVDDNFNLVMEN